MLGLLFFALGFLLAAFLTDASFLREVRQKLESIEKSQAELKEDFKRMREEAKRIHREYE